MRKYTKDHEWVEIDGDEATIGISNYAQEQLGDVVHVVLPDVESTYCQGDEAGEVESFKSTSEIYAPATGEITAINDTLTEKPELINEDAEGSAWFFKMKLSDSGELDSLMDSDAYDDYVKELDA